MSRVVIDGYGEIVESEGVDDLGQLELFGEAWSFCLLWVLGTEEGFYLGTDSGCSCPSPFEHYRGLDDFTGPLTASQAVEEVTSLSDRGDGMGVWDSEGYQELVDAINNYGKETDK